MQEEKNKKNKIFDNIILPRLTEDQCHRIHGASLEILERGAEKVESILGKHKPHPLARKMRENLKKIVSRAVR